jgi:hypothetical protein
VTIYDVAMCHVPEITTTDGGTVCEGLVGPAAVQLSQTLESSLFPGDDWRNENTRRRVASLTPAGAVVEHRGRATR